MRNRLLAIISTLVLGCVSPAFAQNAAWLAKVEGFFASDKNKTPVGEIPFAMDMVKEGDGSVHGRTWADKDSYFDFKFYLNEKGQVLFQETGALPGGLVQSYVLEVTKVDGDTLTFESTKAPGVLVATVTADGKQLHVSTVVRGKPHANLQMLRVAAPEARAAFRVSNAKTKEQATNPLVQQVVQAVMQSSAGDVAGEYEIRPGQTFTVILENGKLFGERTGDAKRELKPDGADGLTIEGVPGNVKFVRDEKGAVTHLQVVVGDQEIARARKIK